MTMFGDIKSTTPRKHISVEVQHTPVNSPTAKVPLLQQQAQKGKESETPPSPPRTYVPLIRKICFLPRQILFSNEAKRASIANKIKNNMLTTPTKHNTTTNDDLVVVGHNDDNVISMNCQCKRISYLQLAMFICFLFYIGNISLSIHFVSSDKSIVSTPLNPENYMIPESFITPKQQTTEYRIPSDRHVHEYSTTTTATKNTTLKRSSGVATTTVTGKRRKRRRRKMSHNKAKAAASGGGGGRTSSFGSLLNQQRQHQRMIEPVFESVSEDANFSACLLIKDDNDILSEWIAYHYHTVKLRYLVVAVDPLSYELPHRILDVWSNYTDLEIEIWNDADYMPPDFLNRQRPPQKYILTAEDLTNVADSNDENLRDKDVMLVISNHRYRQRIFLKSCMKHVKDQDRTWLMHIDTDEYVVPSKLLREMNVSHVTIPDVRESGSILNLLQQVVVKSAAYVNYPCISMLRVLFGSKESDSSELSDVVPALNFGEENVNNDESHFEFDPMKFETLRWKYHALPADRKIHGNPKVILDVAAIPYPYFENPYKPVFSIHRPVVNFCPVSSDLSFSNYYQQPIDVNHYLGSWERYSGRNDKRRSMNVFSSKAEAAQQGMDTYTRPWLSGFVESIGMDTAKILLKSYNLEEPISEQQQQQLLVNNVTVENIIDVPSSLE